MTTTPVAADARLTFGGLENVVMGQTRMSMVDGQAGRLVIGGFDVEDVAGLGSFEALCALLWEGDAAPTAETIARIQARLGSARGEAFEMLPRLGWALDADHGMAALRAGISHLSAPEGGGDPYKVAAAVAVFAAAWTRRQAGQPPIAPRPELPHGHDYLRMATGDPVPAAVDALTAYLITVSDHGMNASTFTARVVTSTGADLVSAITAAIGALKGPLHGGAPGPVLDMLDDVATPERAEPWIRDALAKKERIMGMGHRVYRVRDPRAAVLERHVGPLMESSTSQTRRQRLALARAVEQTAERVLKEAYPDRELRANVEFYTAILLEAAGLPRAAFSSTFAVGRVVGWCAHVAEQRAYGRLIRPRAEYVGVMPGA